MTEELVYIPLSVAKLLADKDKEISNLQEENMHLECKIMSLEEELEYCKAEPNDDPYDFYGVSRSDF